MYGATEATSRMSFLNPYLFNKKNGSIGKPIEGGNLKLLIQIINLLRPATKREN